MTVKDTPTEHAMSDGHFGCYGIKPTTFWLQGGPANRQATCAEGRGKRGIDCLPPAACIIIEQLFGAFDAVLITE